MGTDGLVSDRPFGDQLRPGVQVAARSSTMRFLLVQLVILLLYVFVCWNGSGPLLSTLAPSQSHAVAGLSLALHGGALVLAAMFLWKRAAYRPTV